MPMIAVCTVFNAIYKKLVLFSKYFLLLEDEN